LWADCPASSVLGFRDCNVAVLQTQCLPKINIAPADSALTIIAWANNIFTMSSDSSTQPDASAPGFYRSESYGGQISVGYTMRHIVRLMGLEIDRKMEPHGLTNAQWMPLIKLYERKAGSVAELARSCQLDNGAMTRLLDRVECKGLCRRVRSVSDRRVVNLELTPEGEEAARVIPEVLSNMQNSMLEGFSQAEWLQLVEFLQRILKNAERIQAQADGVAAKGKS
jgi:DNA-binding MarR family transcriptional regulator